RSADGTTADNQLNQLRHSRWGDDAKSAGIERTSDLIRPVRCSALDAMSRRRSMHRVRSRIAKSVPITATAIGPRDASCRRSALVLAVEKGCYLSHETRHLVLHLGMRL